MGLFGRGISFNNQFVPRPIRYGRGPSAPQINIFSGYRTPPTVVQYKPSFWNSAFMMLPFIGMLFQGTRNREIAYTVPPSYPTTTTTTTTTAAEDAALNNLKLRGGETYNVVAHPTNSGIYQAFKKDGTGEVIEGSYDVLMTKLGTTSAQGTGTAQGTDPPLTPQQGTGVSDANPVTPPQDSVDEPEPVDQQDQSGGTGIRSSSSRRSGIPDLWYNAIGSCSDDGKWLEQHIRQGMSARQVTDLILNNKMNYLSTADRNLLANEIEKYNPSIFKDGKVKYSYDISKLDIPSIAYIKKFYIENDSIHDNTVSYTSLQGGKQPHNIINTVTNRNTGRYARFEDGKWHYYAADGTELKEDHISKNDEELYNLTHKTSKSDRNGIWKILSKSPMGALIEYLSSDDNDSSSGGGDKVKAKPAKASYFGAPNT